MTLALQAIQSREPGLCFYTPNSAADYAIKFPGFPDQFYPVLEAAGVPPGQSPYLKYTAGVGLGRRRARKGKKSTRQAKEAAKAP